MIVFAVGFALWWLLDTVARLVEVLLPYLPAFVLVVVGMALLMVTVVVITAVVVFRAAREALRWRLRDVIAARM